MRTTTWRRIAAIGCMAPTLALAACGGDDDGDSGGSSAGSGTAEKASSCKPAGGKAALSFWTWVPGVEKAVAVWNKQNPDIQVKVKETPAGNAGTYQNESITFGHLVGGGIRESVRRLPPVGLLGRW